MANWLHALIIFTILLKGDHHHHHDDQHHRDHYYPHHDNHGEIGSNPPKESFLANWLHATNESLSLTSLRGRANNTQLFQQNQKSKQAYTLPPERTQPQKLCTANFSSGTLKTLINRLLRLKNKIF